ncbi:MAG: site-specific integrase, partial [Solibacillus sp.]
DKLEVFKQNFSTLSKKMKYTKAAALNEYLSYTEYPVDEQYLLLIIETHRANMNLKNSIRTIPSSKDTLKFSLIIEDYFKQDLDMQQYLKYYPIYLWWHLTNIIPIRIGEFCVIQRDCINKIDEEYFITLPRSKRQLG